MGKDLHKKGIEKYQRERLEKIYCSTRKNISSEIAYPFKNLLLRCEFNLRLCAYSSSDRLRTLITVRNLLSAQFFHPLSYKFIVLGSFPISFGFGPQFVTLQLVPSMGRISASKVYNGYGGFRTTPNQSTPCKIS